MQRFAGFEIIDNSAKRHSDLEIFAVLSVFIAALAMLAAARAKDVVVTKFEERVVLIARDDVDAATIAAVSAARAPAGNEFLPTKGDASMAAVSGSHGNLGFVDEHWDGLRHHRGAVKIGSFID